MIHLRKKEDGRKEKTATAESRKQRKREEGFASL